MEIYKKLEEFLKDILEKADDINEILTMEPFLQFISIFPTEMRKEVSTNIL